MMMNSNDKKPKLGVIAAIFALIMLAYVTSINLADFYGKMREKGG